MGKIRVKTLGDESAEAEQKKETLRKAAGKRKRKEAEKKAVEPASPVILSETKDLTSEPKKESKTKKEKFAKKQKTFHSKAYQSVAEVVDRTKTYKLSDALTLLPKLQRAKFDETVELHINTLEPGVLATVSLPHGTGKKIRVAIADDKVIAQVEKGVIDFDVLLATPQIMGKLAKVAKYLGPRGLMPNPKNGTITQKPEEVAKKYEAGQVTLKTEAKSPIMHLTVGKVSFGDKKLKENIDTVFAAIPSGKIRNVTLKSTMSPGIKISL